MLTMLEKLCFACFVALCYIVAVSSGLQCYVCTSQDDSRCAETFGYTGLAAKDILKTCDDNTKACRKMVSEDYIYKTLVVRECYNRSLAVPITYKDLCHDMANAKSCYCVGSKCNGQPGVRAAQGLMGVAITLSLVLARSSVL
ncbi:hypothetical protein ScPMuIL_002739 [Solemya velum]